MPEFLSAYRNDSQRIEAWARHYEAKGCHPSKAIWVARDKCRKSSTWPPAT